MINSFYNQPPPPDKQSLCAQAYEPDGTPILNKFHVYPEQAAAGLWMTPSDLCNYIIDMQLAYKGGKSKVLSPEMVKLHLTRYTSDGPTALGTFVENRKGALYFQHGAGNDGFCGTFYGSLEDGYGAVIFMNTSNPKLLNEVLNSVAKAYDWKNFYEAPSERKSIQQDEAVVKSLEGIYLFEGKWATVIKKEGEYRYYSDGVYAKMYFTDQNNFFNEEFSSEKEIVKDDKGNVAGFKRSLNGTQLSFAPRLTQIDTLSISEGMFNDIGWFLLENKKNTEALTYLKRANKLYPKSLIVLGNLAHAYLFTNDFEKALNIYKKHLGTIIDRDYTWNEMVKQDLLFFKKNGYDTTLLDKVFTELKLEKPEGY
jgi:tetratricopeptide (TPR) repeat protein